MEKSWENKNERVFFFNRSEFILNILWNTQPLAYHSSSEEAGEEQDKWRDIVGAEIL